MRGAPAAAIGVGAAFTLGAGGGTLGTTDLLASQRSTLPRSAPAPRQPADVLSFWFGAAGTATEATPEYVRAQAKRWFMGGSAMDEQARAFAPLIRAAGAGDLDGAEWSTQDGLVAQLVLLDQLSRNAFRGTHEDFAFDEAAVGVACRLVGSLGAPSELPSSAGLFVVTCLMHTEDLGQHEAAAAFCAAHVEASGSVLLAEQAAGDLPAHTAVLRRFGRYPHRNGLKRRATTAEEAAWLSSDECPGWAKSQATRKNK